VQLTVATADTGRLTKAAMFGLDCIWRDNFLYEKAGAVQGSLFLCPDDPRNKPLMASIDVLNRRYGRGTIGYGTATGAKGWTLRADHLSGRYTTRWGDLLAV
jgi:DNA polymerase V